MSKSHEKYRIPYEQGHAARLNGFERINPYGALKAAIYWQRGFDNLPIDYVHAPKKDTK